MLNSPQLNLRVNEIIFIFAGIMTILGVFLYEDWGGYVWIMTKAVYILGVFFLFFDDST